MENTSDNQEKEKKRRVGRKKLVVTVIGVGMVLTAAGVAGTIYYRQTQSSTTQENGGQWGHQGGMNMNDNLVTASGTTSIGVDAVTFAIDFLEDTSLYVEEVYVSSGDEVEAGTKYLKFTDDSIEDARSELESTAREAQIAYRSGVITTQESKIEAKYTYQQTLLDAQQVYEDTLASLQATLDAAEDEYTQAQDDYNEYLYKVENNTFSEDYEIETKKTAYEEAYDLYVDRVEYWELTEDELDSLDSSSASMSGSSTTTVSTSTTSSDSSGQGSAGGMMMGGNASSQAAAREEQEAKADRQWILKTVALLKERMEEAEEDYEQAKEDYEDEIDGAELKLQKLLNTYESKREAYEAAQITYQKIGIMNVLFVSVKERTNEIGILKALGCSKRDILLEFLLEACFMSLIGAILGVLLALGITPIVESLSVRVELSVSGAVLSLAFGVITGTIFGFYPAYKASTLIPVVALNQE